MNFHLKHLMREQFCVHNIVTWKCFCWRNTSGPLGSGPLQWLRVMPCLLNIHQAVRARASTLVNPLISCCFFKLRQYNWCHLTHCASGPLPYVPVAAAVAGWQGLAGAVCPQSSGPVAQTGDERTCWHSRFLYRQEVGVAPEQMPCIIGRFS